MSPTQHAALRALQRTVLLAGIAGVAFAEPVHLSLFARTQVEQPAAAEFGAGPRASASRLYQATLKPAQPLALRRLLTVPVLITDADGRPVEDATVTIDGGMPEHAHGLPTQPRITRSLGGGLYEIEGLRFSMGGWWQLHLAIASPAGRDRVTFNLAL